MRLNEKKMLENVCRYCVNKYQILNNAPILSSFIYQLGKKFQIDIPAVRGIIHVEANGYKLQFAHCFNVCNGQIVDTSIYQYALINQRIENLFPLYIVGMTPDHIDYSISSEIKYKSQFRFKDEYLLKTLKEIKDLKHIELRRFSIIEDAKKENLVF